MLIWAVMIAPTSRTVDDGGTLAPSITALAMCPFGKMVTAPEPPLPELLPSTPACITFVALSKFVIANGMALEVKTAFRNRPHMVDDAVGFLRMEVISPLERPEEIWLITFWRDEGSFQTWHHSHLYHDSHKGIPKGLKLVPGETKMRGFEHVAS